MKKGLITKSGYQSYKVGHPWIKASDIVAKDTIPKRPGLVYFGDYWWFCSPDSFLRLRRLGPNQPQWMRRHDLQQITNADLFAKIFGDWLKEHLLAVLEKKIAALSLAPNERCLRWVFSENDLLPGLIVDVFGETVVAQINSAPIEAFWFPIRSAILNAFEAFFKSSPHLIELRNSPIRKKEGLEIIQPEPLPAQRIFWNGFSWWMSPGQAQKTGAYFDQRENHLRVAQIAKSKGAQTAWDLCCYQGGFTLHLLNCGLSVIGVDQSESALDTTTKNIELNGLAAGSFTPHRADIFTWLREAHGQNLKSDIIVLDPPSLVKSRESIFSASRAYTELNTLALQCLNPGGTLVSCVCSHHMSQENYSNILGDSAKGANTRIKILSTYGPSPDHTPALEFPEGHYFHAWFLEIPGPTKPVGTLR